MCETARKVRRSGSRPCFRSDSNETASASPDAKSAQVSPAPPHSPTEQQVSAAFADHDCRRVGVAARHLRADRAIDHAQIGEAVNAQRLLVDHRRPRVRTHPAGAGRVMTVLMSCRTNRSIAGRSAGSTRAGATISFTCACSAFADRILARPERPGSGRRGRPGRSGSSHRSSEDPTDPCCATPPARAISVADGRP